MQLPGQRRLQAGSTLVIQPGQSFSVSISKIKNSGSMEPSSNSVEYFAYADGNIIEQQTMGLVLQNKEPGYLVRSSSTIMPDDFQQSFMTNYTLQFSPVNFQRGMSVKLTLPQEISFSQSLVLCYGLEGTDREVLTCATNKQEKSITVTNAFENSVGNPGLVKILYRTLKNPQRNIFTGSFKLETFNQNGFLLDKLTEGLDVNFYCSYPCRSCNYNEPTKCLECYLNTDFFILFDSSCVQQCPSGFTTTPLTDQNCTRCNPDCQTCEGDPDTCTSCFEGYRLDGENCLQRVLWPFPWLILRGFQFILDFLSEILTKT